MNRFAILTVAPTTVPTMIVILIGILISEMLHRVGDLDSRLTRIENGLGMNRA